MLRQPQWKNLFFFAVACCVLPGRRLDTSTARTLGGTHVGPWKAYYVTPCFRQLIVHPYDRSYIISIHICHEAWDAASLVLNQARWHGLDASIRTRSHVFSACLPRIHGVHHHQAPTRNSWVMGKIKTVCQEIPTFRTLVSTIEDRLKLVYSFILGCASCLSSFTFSGQLRLEHFCQQK